MIGLALLGAGRMAKVHAEAISAAGATLVTVFDVAKAAADSLASKTGASVARTAVDPEIGKLGDIDTACVTLVTPSGKQAVILNSRRSAYGFDQRIEAFGSAGVGVVGKTKTTCV